MVIALGQAVRYAEYAIKSEKEYRARLWLGEETDTLDLTGKVIDSRPVPIDWQERLSDVSRKLTGKIMQAPPAFSAKQVDGRRSYKAARSGEKLDLEPVEVEIFSLEFAGTTDNWVDFTARVSGENRIGTV
jgi:tRNA pseudouridine55 synthase